MNGRGVPNPVVEVYRGATCTAWRSCAMAPSGGSMMTYVWIPNPRPANLVTNMAARDGTLESGHRLVSVVQQSSLFLYNVVSVVLLYLCYLVRIMDMAIVQYREDVFKTADWLSVYVDTFDY